MRSSLDSLRDDFWASLPLPEGLKLIRQEAIVLPQVGRAGVAIYDRAVLQWGGNKLPLLLVTRPSVLAGEILSLKERLLKVIDERRRRELAIGHAVPFEAVPGIITSSAMPSVIEACAKESVALFDLRGTAIVHAERAFIHVQGRGQVQHKGLKVNLFSGKAARLVRVLLEAPQTPKGLRTLASESQTSYGYVYGVIQHLQNEGWVTRASVRSGYFLRDAPGLLRAWLQSSERTAVAVEKYYAPSTQSAALVRAEAARREAGVQGIFTLASALKPEEVFVSGLPHGMYLAGTSEPVVEALGLRPTTPYNFFILRAEPAAETTAGGIYFAARPLEHGLGVALPQLAADCQQAGGRGPEQAKALLERYVKALPMPVEAT